MDNVDHPRTGTEHAGHRASCPGVPRFSCRRLFTANVWEL